MLDAAEIRIRAERRLGEMIAEQKAKGLMAKGTRGQLRGSTDGSGGSVLDPPERNEITLAEAGIDKKLSSRAQKLAAVPEVQKATGLIAKGTRGQLRGRDSSGGSKADPPERRDEVSLADAGIDYKLSSRAQKLAAVPEVLVA